jgi:hypothetical protein
VKNKGVSQIDVGVSQIDEGAFTRKIGCPQSPIFGVELLFSFITRLVGRRLCSTGGDAGVAWLTWGRGGEGGERRKQETGQMTATPGKSRLSVGYITRMVDVLADSSGPITNYLQVALRTDADCEPIISL